MGAAGPSVLESVALSRDPFHRAEAVIVSWSPALAKLVACSVIVAGSGEPSGSGIVVAMEAGASVAP